MMLEIDVTKSMSLTGQQENQLNEQLQSLLPQNTEIRRDNNILSERSILNFPLYRIAPLGRGSSSTVYKSVQLNNLQVYAEKVLTVTDPSKKIQVLREIDSLRSIFDIRKESLGSNSTKKHRSAEEKQEIGEEERDSCPFIVKLYHVYQNPWDGNLSLCLEYMNAGSLQDFVLRGGCSHETILSSIAYQILSGLNYLHEKRMLHRDVKPSNALISKQGHVKLSDFGLAKVMDLDRSLADSFIGTFEYMAPERLSGEAYSVKSDIWSFGLSLHTFATGSFPYATKRGFWELLYLTQQENQPLPPSDVFSNDFITFIASMHNKDMNIRPNAEQLLQFPFVQSKLSIIPYDLWQSYLNNPQLYQHQSTLQQPQETLSTKQVIDSESNHTQQPSQSQQTIERKPSFGTLTKMNLQKKSNNTMTLHSTMTATSSTSNKINTKPTYNIHTKSNPVIAGHSNKHIPLSSRSDVNGTSSGVNSAHPTPRIIQTHRQGPISSNSSSKLSKPSTSTKNSSGNITKQQPDTIKPSNTRPTVGLQTKEKKVNTATTLGTTSIKTINLGTNGATSQQTTNVSNGSQKININTNTNGGIKPKGVINNNRSRDSSPNISTKVIIKKTVTKTNVPIPPLQVLPPPPDINNQYLTTADSLSPPAPISNLPTTSNLIESFSQSNLALDHSLVAGISTMSIIKDEGTIVHELIEHWKDYILQYYYSLSNTTNDQSTLLQQPVESTQEQSLPSRRLQHMASQDQLIRTLPTNRTLNTQQSQYEIVPLPPEIDPMKSTTFLSKDPTNVQPTKALYLTKQMILSLCQALEFTNSTSLIKEFHYCIQEIQTFLRDHPNEEPPKSNFPHGLGLVPNASMFMTRQSQSLSASSSSNSLLNSFQMNKQSSIPSQLTAENLHLHERHVYEDDLEHSLTERTSSFRHSFAMSSQDNLASSSSFQPMLKPSKIEPILKETTFGASNTTTKGVAMSSSMNHDRPLLASKDNSLYIPDDEHSYSQNKPMISQSKPIDEHSSCNTSAIFDVSIEEDAILKELATIIRQPSHDESEIEQEIDEEILENENEEEDLKVFNSQKKRDSEDDNTEFGESTVDTAESLKNALIFDEIDKVSVTSSKNFKTNNQKNNQNFTMKQITTKNDSNSMDNNYEDDDFETYDDDFET